MSKTELHITKGVALLFALIMGFGTLGTIGAIEQAGDVSWWQLIAFVALLGVFILIIILCEKQEELDELRADAESTFVKAHGKEPVTVPAEFEKVDRDKPCLNYRPTWEKGVPDEDGKVQKFRFTPEFEESEVKHNG